MEVLLYVGGLNVIWHKEQIVEFKIKADHSPLGPTFSRTERKDDHAHSGRFCCNFTVMTPKAVKLHITILECWTRGKLLSHSLIFLRVLPLWRHWAYGLNICGDELHSWGWGGPFHTAVERCVHVHFHVYVWENWLGLQTLQKTVEPFQIRMHDMFFFPTLILLPARFCRYLLYRTSVDWSFCTNKGADGPLVIPTVVGTVSLKLYCG